MALTKQAKTDNWPRTILLAALYASPALLAIGSLLQEGSQNPDLWWHLSTGAWITQHHAVPVTDPFSTYGMNKPWVAYSWLFEVIIHQLYKWLGLVGPGVYLLLMVVAIGVVLHRAISSRMGGFTEPYALTGFTLFAMAPLYSVRPWLFSILFFTIELDILFPKFLDMPEGRATRRVWLLPLLFAFWANVHIQFVYGLAILVFAALIQHVALMNIPESLQTVTAPDQRQPNLWVVTGVSFLATLANPYSWRIYLVAREYAGENGSYNLVSELMAPRFRSLSDYIPIVVVLVAAYVLGRARLRSSVFTNLLLMGTTLVSLHSSRDRWACLVVAMLIIAEVCGKEIPAIAPLPRAYRFVALPLALMFVFAWAKGRGLSNARLEDITSHAFPAKAAEFVMQRGLPGPLYNDFDWGGYLIWRLPRLPVSMDGRTNVHGDARIVRSVATWRCMSGWKNDPEFAAANLVIGPAESPLSSFLKGDTGYQLMYEDETAVVFVKRAN